MKKWFFLPLLCAALLCGCAREPSAQERSAQVFAMDTMMDITVYADDTAAAESALSAAEAEIHRLDGLLSRHDEASAVAAVNASSGAPVAVDEEVLSLLETAVSYSAQTGDAFDITVAPIMDAWSWTPSSSTWATSASYSATAP